MAKETSIAGLLGNLESLYKKKSLTNRLYVKKRTFTLKMVEGSSLDQYIDEIDPICDTLATIDKALDDVVRPFLESYKYYVEL